MTAYNISSFAGAGAQFLDDNGAPLSGGKLYTYAAGTTTPAATYTTTTGSAANTNPIILDAAGRTPNEIWLPVGNLYKFVLKSSTDVLIGTYDGIPAVNDPYSINSLLSGVTGTNTISASATPAITAYATGATYSFIAANTNSAAVTLSIDGLTAKSITKNGSAALSAGDIQAGKMTWVEYDGATFQLLNNIVYGGSITNATINSLSTPLTVANGGTGAGTFTANALLVGNGLAAFQTVAPGTAGQVLTSDGTNWVSAASASGTPNAIGQVPFSTNGTTYTPTLKITAMTAVTSTSGTAIDFTGIPSWVKRITVMLNGVSLSSTSALLVQLGTSSGVTTSGYSAYSAIFGSTSFTSSAYTTGLGIRTVAGTASISGAMTISLLNNNIWVAAGNFADGAAINGFFSAGGVTLAATLDRVRITSAGADTFDAGTINVLYE